MNLSRPIARHGLCHVFSAKLIIYVIFSHILYLTNYLNRVLLGNISC